MELKLPYRLIFLPGWGFYIRWCKRLNASSPFRMSYPSHESKKESRMFSPVKGNEWGKLSTARPEHRDRGESSEWKDGPAVSVRHWLCSRISSCAAWDLKVSFSMRSKSHIHYWLTGFPHSLIGDKSSKPESNHESGTDPIERWESTSAEKGAFEG